MKQIGDKLRRCTRCSLTNLTALIQNVLEDRFVAILVSDHTEIFLLEGNEL